MTSLQPWEEYRIYKVDLPFHNAHEGLDMANLGFTCYPQICVKDSTSWGLSQNMWSRNTPWSGVVFAKLQSKDIYGLCDILSRIVEMTYLMQGGPRIRGLTTGQSGYTISVELVGNQTETSLRKGDMLAIKGVSLETDGVRQIIASKLLRLMFLSILCCMQTPGLR